MAKVVASKARAHLLLARDLALARATAELFAREGAQVGVADVNVAEASLTLETIRAAGGNAEVYELDVAQPAQVKRAIAAYTAATRSIHVPINNAGVVVGGAAGELSDADWSRNLEVNLGGASLCGREALAIMVPQAVRRHRECQLGCTALQRTS